MRWTASAVEGEDTGKVAARLVRDLRHGLAGEPAHLVVLFATPHHRRGLGALAARVRASMPGARVVGTTAASVLARGRELEDTPAVAALAGSLPDVGVVPFRGTAPLLEAAMTDPRAWHRHLDLIPEQQPVFLLLPDPLTHRTDALLASLDAAFPGLPKLGGLASGGRRAGDHALVLDDAVHTVGAVGVALYGDIAVDAIVAQGARPVGPDLAVTAADDNVVVELDGQPAAPALDGVYARLSKADQARFRRTPLAGLALPDRSADYLVRNVLGVEREGGRLSVGGPVRTGQRLRFHVRDPAAAAEDLRGQLLRWRALGAGEAEAALLFSCLGRGEAFFGVRDHDSTILAELLGDVPLAGFFGNGEIGPVQGRSFTHGYTSAVAIFRARGWC